MTRNTGWGTHVRETMATSTSDLLIKQRSVIEFLAAEGCSAANIHARIKTVYGVMCISDWKFANGWELLKGKTSPSPRKFKVVASARKVMFTVFWDMEGVVHMEFLEQGQTVNCEPYFQHSELSNSDSDVFGVMRTHPIQQHDNEHPQSSRQTHDAIRQLELKTLPHHAYSPDLAPFD